MTEFTIGFFLFGVVGYIFSLFFDGLFGGLFKGYLLATGVAVVLLFVWAERSSKEDAKREEQERQEKEKQRTEFIEEVEQGKWIFPAKEYYNKCKESHCLALNNEYSIAKAKNIALSLIRNECNDINEQSCGAYISEQAMNAYIKIGEKQQRDEEEAQLQKLKEPQEAMPTKNEETFIARANALKNLTGSDKREQMLRDLLSDYDARITAIQEGEEAMKTLGMIYLDQQKKESSWAVMGGIAEGIAGPAAGVAAAANTIANNAKIRSFNDNMRKTTMGILSGAAELSEDRHTLEKEREKILGYKSEVKKKISLSTPSSTEIWKNIKTSSPTFKRNKSGVLSVSVNVNLKKPLTINVPDAVQLVVDGTLKATVYFEKAKVGEVLLPLPLYGVPTNSTTGITLDGMCSSSVKYDGQYTLQFEKTQNLWVMEL